MRERGVGKTMTITGGGVDTERQGEGGERKASVSSKLEQCPVPSLQGPAARANCGKEGFQVGSAATQRTPNQKLGEQWGLHL